MGCGGARGGRIQRQGGGKDAGEKGRLFNNSRPGSIMVVDAQHLCVATNELVQKQATESFFRNKFTRRVCRLREKRSYCVDTKSRTALFLLCNVPMMELVKLTDTYIKYAIFMS